MCITIIMSIIKITSTKVHRNIVYYYVYIAYCYKYIFTHFQCMHATKHEFHLKCPFLCCAKISLQDLMAKAMAVLVGLQAVPVGITAHEPMKRLVKFQTREFVSTTDSLLSLSPMRQVPYIIYIQL